MEKVLAGALVLVGSGLLLLAGLVTAVLLKRWAASRGDETTARQGELETRLDRLESRQKLLQGEWNETHSKLDTLVRRAVRLGVIERKDGEGAEPAEVQPTTRAGLLKRYRETQGGR